MANSTSFSSYYPMFLIFIVFAIIPATANSIDIADIERGKLLYGNYCKECHDPWRHSRQESEIKTPTDLKRRIIGWQVHKNLSWQAQDVNDVYHYLNQQYYHFNRTQQ